MFGFVARTKSVKQRTQSLVRLNLELAQLEAKKKAMALGVAGGLALLAGVLVVYAIGFAFASAAAGISEALPWLSLLIVAGLLLLSQRSLDSWQFAPPARLPLKAGAGDRGGRAHGRNASEPCLSATPRRSGMRSLLNGSASTTISRRCNPRSDRSDCWWLPVSLWSGW